jgi:hypothetical protein
MIVGDKVRCTVPGGECYGDMVVVSITGIHAICHGIAGVWTFLISHLETITPPVKEIKPEKKIKWREFL